MAKGAYIGVDSVARKIKKGYIGVDGVARKIKKAYIGVGGVATPFWSGGVSDMVITSTGAMLDRGVVTMSDGNQYRLLEVTASGSITFESPVEGEVWMCGGGTSGSASHVTNRAAGGGAGAFTAGGKISLSGTMTAIIGAGGTKQTSQSTGNHGGATSFGGLQTSVNFTAISTDFTVYQKGMSGGTGGGDSRKQGAGSGDGIQKYPFGDSAYFKCHCAGGGGGGYRASSSSVRYSGGAGGTNGGSGGTNSSSGSYNGGTGGSFGGGNGGYGGTTADSNKGGDATFYGSAGGGAGSASSASSFGDGGAGYQGVLYIRIPVNQ